MRGNGRLGGGIGQSADDSLLSPGRCTLRLMTSTIDDARAYITKVRWQFAKTMPQWPHEYTVRQWRPDLEAEFFEFAAVVRGQGVVKPWPPEASRPRYHHTYLEVDDWEYWTMGEPIGETTVINRALIVQPKLGHREGTSAISPPGELTAIQLDKLPTI